MRRIQDVSVDKVELQLVSRVMQRNWDGPYIVFQSSKPLIVTLLNVFAPEMLSFEELGAFRDLAAILGFVFLLDKLERVLRPKPLRQACLPASSGRHTRARAIAESCLRRS